MKIRHLSAILGVAIAVGAVVFMSSLVATSDHQALARAEEALNGDFLRALRDEINPLEGLRCASLALDYRPDGHVMQGPPMTVTAVSQARGLAMHCSVRQMMKAAATNELPGVAVTKALFTQRRLEVPPVGSELTLVGRRGAYRVRIREIFDQARPARGLPNMFIYFDDAEAIHEEWRDWKVPTAAELAPAFTSDAERNFDRAKALLLWAAALTALCLLVNSLFLSVEAKRREIAILRLLGLTRAGVVRRMLVESLGQTAAGVFLGVTGGLGALAVYVFADSATFPMGLAVASRQIAVCLLLAPVVAGLSVLIALKSALAVRPLEAASNRFPRRRHRGMLISFACGFGAFVAVEVWGCSLTKPFIPSPEWPDAVVSILPAGVSSFDIEKLQSLPGVRRIAELQPLQVNFQPLEEQSGARGGGGRGPQYRNALLLASDWLPDFRFVEGDRASAVRALHEGAACIITEMMARARRLKVGDELPLAQPLKIVGIVDLNWHMVTSRGLLRGLNRMPVNTDGPVFVSFDTLADCDRRPAFSVKMTHLWLDYDPAFLAQHGVFEAGRRVEREIAAALSPSAASHDLGNTIRLHARDEIADGTLAHGAELVGAMARVPFIFIVVISLGFVAMMIASADARKREFVMLRAVGATPLQRARMLAGEALKVAFGGVLIGFPGGALVGWLSTAGTRATMASWGLPACFDLPVVTCLEGALGAVLFALAIIVPTAALIIRKKNVW